MKSSTNSRAFTVISLLVAATIGFSASFFGIYAVEKSAASHFDKIKQAFRGHYTTDPVPAYLGNHPGRDPVGRGRVWTKTALRQLHSPGMDPTLLASLRGGEQVGGGVHTLAVESAPGTSYPWEGSSPLKELLDLFEESGGATEKTMDKVRALLQKLESTADDWIQTRCKGSINREFPDQFRKNTLEEIRNFARKNNKLAKKAWKLINDGRFAK